MSGVAPAPAVLIADDDPVARDLLAEVLAKEGYRVASAGGGGEALELARGTPIDLAIVDLRMPDLDGLAVLRGLHGLRPGVPVVILTAFATIETAMEAIRAGAYDYLSKPFQLDLIRLAGAAGARGAAAPLGEPAVPPGAAGSASAPGTWSARARPWSRSMAWRPGSPSVTPRC